MVTIIEYVFAQSPRAIEKLIESKVLQENSIKEIPLKTIIASEKREQVSYRRLMNHDKWQRTRGGSIRQVSHYEK